MGTTRRHPHKSNGKGLSQWRILHGRRLPCALTPHHAPLSKSIVCRVPSKRTFPLVGAHRDYGIPPHARYRSYRRPCACSHASGLDPRHPILNWLRPRRHPSGHDDPYHDPFIPPRRRPQPQRSRNGCLYPHRRASSQKLRRFRNRP